MFVNGSFINHLVMVFLKCYFYKLDAIFLFVLTVIMSLLCYNFTLFLLKQNKKCIFSETGPPWDQLFCSIRSE